MPNLAEIYNNQQNKKPIEKKEQSSSQINLVIHMPEVSGLIRHLDLLYSRMIINDMNSQNNQNISWYNPGQGSVKQSDSVN